VKHVPDRIVVLQYPCRVTLTDNFSLQDPDIQFPDSIALNMLEVVKTQIMEKRGILLSTDLEGSKGTDQGTLGLERHVGVDAAKSRHGGQYMFMDAERVGWSGEPSIFQHLAVTAVCDTCIEWMHNATCL